MNIHVSGGLEIHRITDSIFEAKITANVNEHTFLYKTKTDNEDEYLEFMANVIGKSHPTNGFLFEDIKKQFVALDDHDIVPLVVGLVISITSNPPTIINPPE